MSEQLSRIGISIGDTNGIGPEIVLKSAAHLCQRRMDLQLIVYAALPLLREQAAHFGIDGLSMHLIDSPAEAVSGVLNIISSIDEDLSVQLGSPTPASGEAARDSLAAAGRALLAGDLSALVTAPIDKKNMQSSDFDYPGHTEYLGALAPGHTPLMFLVSAGLKVGVVTGHIPLSKVSGALTQDSILRRLRAMHHSLRQDFGLQDPRIAVLGLNPHAGDGGLIGSDEIDLISPTIERAVSEGIRAIGPLPADGLFGSKGHEDFDAVLAMYHDQGLVPFKVIAFGAGVNFTAGLPFVRTSPDHGTAFDIAGRGIASEASMIQAIEYADMIVTQRRSSAAGSVD